MESQELTKARKLLRKYFLQKNYNYSRIQATKLLIREHRKEFLSYVHTEQTNRPLVEPELEKRLKGLSSETIKELAWKFDRQSYIRSLYRLGRKGVKK